MFSAEWERTPDERKMCAALEKVAAEVGAKSITAGVYIAWSSIYFPPLTGIAQLVAIAYVMQKTPYVFPLIGGRKVDHFESNLEALEISLTAKHISYLESILPFDPGFPTRYFVSVHNMSLEQV